MSQPGWYPDPRGGNEPAYWDGTRWVDQPARRSSPIGWVVAGLLLIGTLVLVMILQPTGFLGAASPGVEDSRSARPTVRPWDERTADPSEPQSEDTGDSGDPTQCPDVGIPHSTVDADGRMHAGGLSIVAPMTPDWIGSSTFMPWMSEQNSRVRPVAEGWVASVDVGSVRAVDGFTSPQQAVKAMLSCMASSWMYQGYTGHEVLVSEADSLDGHPGWYLKANVYVDRPDGIKGDVLDIWIYDLGRDGELGVVVGCATIDHEPSIREVGEAVSTRRVD